MLLKTILLNKALSEKKIKLQINNYLGDVHLTFRDIFKSN